MPCPRGIWEPHATFQVGTEPLNHPAHAGRLLARRLLARRLLARRLLARRLLAPPSRHTEPFIRRYTRIERSRWAVLWSSNLAVFHIPVANSLQCV